MEDLGDFRPDTTFGFICPLQISSVHDYYSILIIIESNSGKNLCELFLLTCLTSWIDQNDFFANIYWLFSVCVQSRSIPVSSISCRRRLCTRRDGSKPPSCCRLTTSVRTDLLQPPVLLHLVSLRISCVPQMKGGVLWSSEDRRRATNWTISPLNATDAAAAAVSESHELFQTFIITSAGSG